MWDFGTRGWGLGLANFMFEDIPRSSIVRATLLGRPFFSDNFTRIVSFSDSLKRVTIQCKYTDNSTENPLEINWTSTGNPVRIQ